MIQSEPLPGHDKPGPPPLLFAYIPRLKGIYRTIGEIDRDSKRSEWFWLVGGLVLFLVGLLTALALWPGGSLIERLRWLDSGICAQLPGHSFYPGGEQLPLCARNTGIYLGFMVTLITLYATGRGKAQLLPRWYVMVVLVGGVVAMVVDGLNSFLFDLGVFHLYSPNNLLRLATGLITGLALASLSLPILNRLFWREYYEERSITSWGRLVPFVLILLASFFIVAFQSWIALYPVALLSTAGLLVALSSVNVIVVIAVSRRDQSFKRYRDLVPFLSVALVLAIGELLLLAQLKVVVLQSLGV